MFAADVLSALMMHAHVLKSVGPAAPGSTYAAVAATEHESMAKVTKTSITPWSAMLRGAYTCTARGGWLAVLVLTPLLTPLLSVTVHVQTFVTAAWLVWRSLCGTDPKQCSWAYMGCLDIERCSRLRSFIVAFVEGPATMFFATWAYLAPYKSIVRTYIGGTKFLFSVVTSMLHILIEVWDLLQQLGERGSWGAVWRNKMQVGIDGGEATNKVSSSSDSKAAHVSDRADTRGVRDVAEEVSSGARLVQPELGAAGLVQPDGSTAEQGQGALRTGRRVGWRRDREAVVVFMADGHAAAGGGSVHVMPTAQGRNQ
jgi:hypothetical protein